MALHRQDPPSASAPRAITQHHHGCASTDRACGSKALGMERC